MLRLFIPFVLEYKILRGCGSRAWGCQGYVRRSIGDCGVSEKSSTSRKKVSQTFSLRGVCSYFLLGIKEASSGFSELVIPTVALLVLLNVTPRQLLCCVLAYIGYHWILDGGGLRSWERREKGGGITSLTSLSPFHPHHIEFLAAWGPPKPGSLQRQGSPVQSGSLNCSFILYLVHFSADKEGRICPDEDMENIENSQSRLLDCFKAPLQIRSFALLKAP